MHNIRKVIGILVAFAIFNVGFIAQAHASDSVWSLDSFYQSINNLNFTPDNSVSSQPTVVAQSSPSSVKAKASIVAKKMTVTVTAYSSSVDETDDSPFITANGTYVRDGIVAANFLPFGTAVKIPALFGDKIFVVTDRMNQRFSDRMDIWMPSKNAAFQFGLKKVVIEIVS